jgi:hypothetical protein
MGLFTISVQELLDQDFFFGLGPLDYPIFDEEYRDQLNDKILDHYRDYEIGQETEEKFRFYLNRRMNEQMPLFNQFYLSTRIEFDPLQTMKYTDFTNTTDSRTRSGTKTDNGSKTSNGTNSNTGTGTSTSGSRNVLSDTPQVQLSGNEDYASSANDANSTATTNQTSSGTNSDTITSTDTVNSSDTDTANASIERSLNGQQGLPAADLLMRYRATFLNIDMMVIASLQDLFMQVWDNGDEFSTTDRTSGYGFPGIGWFGII